MKHVGVCPWPEPHSCDVQTGDVWAGTGPQPDVGQFWSVNLNLDDRHSHMIQVPGAEDDPALPVAIGVDGVLGKTALQVKGALR